MGEPTKDDLVVLGPGESYRKTLSYALRDSASLAVGKVHSIQVTYGQFLDLSPKFPDLFKGVVESNKALFEITYCENVNSSR